MKFEGGCIVIGFMNETYDQILASPWLRRIADHHLRMEKEQERETIILVFVNIFKVENCVNTMSESDGERYRFGCSKMWEIQ